MSARLVMMMTAALVGSARLVHAQAPPLPEPGAPPAETPPLADQTGATYEHAFDSMLRGELAAASAGFHDVAARASDPERVLRARELARLADEMIAHRLRIETSGERTDAERDDQDDGRTSLIALTTLYGLYAGVVVVVDADIHDFRAGVATITATTAVGLFGSYFATAHEPITGADADAYSLGLLAGAANGGLLVHPVGLGDSSGHATTTVLVTSAAGAAAGLGLSKAYHPTRGQVAFAGSLALLGAASTGLGIGVAQPSLDADNWLVAIAAGTDAGLGLGVALGRNVNWSVSRGRLVQLGVLLGGLTGVAVGALITGTDTGSDSTARTLSATTLAGMWGGFGAAVGFTGNMRVDRSFRTGAPTATLAPMPVRGGGGVTLVGSF